MADHQHSLTPIDNINLQERNMAMKPYTAPDQAPEAHNEINPSFGLGLTNAAHEDDPFDFSFLAQPLHTDNTTRAQASKPSLTTPLLNNNMQDRTTDMRDISQAAELGTATSAQTHSTFSQAPMTNNAQMAQTQGFVTANTVQEMAAACGIDPSTFPGGNLDIPLQDVLEGKNFVVKEPFWNFQVWTTEDAAKWLKDHPISETNKVCIIGVDDVDAVSSLAHMHAMDLFKAMFKPGPPAERGWNAEKLHDYDVYQYNGTEEVKGLTGTTHGYLRAQSQCILTVGELVRLHTHGLPPSSKTAQFDGTLKASDRIAEVIKALEIKHIAKSVIQGSAKVISDLVQHPIHLRKARVDAIGGNSTKKSDAKVGREAKGTDKKSKKGAKGTTTPANLSSPSTPQSNATPFSSGSAADAGSPATESNGRGSGRKRNAESFDATPQRLTASKRSKKSSKLHLGQSTQIQTEDSLPTPTQHIDAMHQLGPRPRDPSFPGYQAAPPVYQPTNQSNDDAFPGFGMPPIQGGGNGERMSGPIPQQSMHGDQQHLQQQPQGEGMAQNMNIYPDPFIFNNGQFTNSVGNGDYPMPPGNGDYSYLLNIGANTDPFNNDNQGNGGEWPADFNFFNGANQWKGN